MVKQLTIRNVPDEVAERLVELSEEQNSSVNRLVVTILEQAVGAEGRRERLKRYITWTEDDFKEFNEALAEQRVVDDKLWR